MARLEELRPGVRIRHDHSSPSLRGATGTVAERQPGTYIDASIPEDLAVWVVWDNPRHLKRLAPGWTAIEALEVIG